MKIDLRPLGAHDLPEVDRIFRLAFGTFLGVPEPQSFMGDADMINARWRTVAAASLGAYGDGVLVGSSKASPWGGPTSPAITDRTAS